MIVLVVAGGENPRADALQLAGLASLPTPYVIAADQGISHALALGLRIDEAVGDFDSVDPADLALAKARGAKVEQFSSEKNASDLELALYAAVAKSPDRIVVIAGSGGRLDHELVNFLLLAHPDFAKVPITALVGGAAVGVIRHRAVLVGQAGQFVSLIPMGGDAHGVSTEGLRYVLLDEPLRYGHTRGLSNELTSDRAFVEVRQGCLLAVAPEAPLHIDTELRFEPSS
ncbi:MAG: thiamine diphosphokinase [Corynebacteriales bacterium]|nr:thiamine diphosphokinase [Mycobacteriales bacterium]